MLKRTIAIILVSLIAFPIAFAQTPPLAPPREAAPLETISVTGTGRVQLTPDRVTFSVGVETSAPTVADAVEENSRKVARIIAALKKAGVQDKEVRTSNFSVNPQYDYQRGPKPQLTGYQVNNMVTVTRDKTADVSKLLQAAIDSGANQIHGVSFVVADMERSRDQGLRAAFDDARAKADVLARAAGRTLGRAIAITEGTATVPPIYPMQMRGMAEGMVAAKAPDVPVEQGSEEIRHTVSVVFELR